LTKLAATVFKKSLDLGVHPHSFARFFQRWLTDERHCENLILFAECNQSMAQQYAREAHLAWGVCVRPITFDQLQTLSAAKIRDTHFIVTVPYHYEQARRIARARRKSLITVSASWHESIVSRIVELGTKAKVAFVFEHKDFEQIGQWIPDEMKRFCPGDGITFEVFALEQLTFDLSTMNKWDLVFFSNLVWDSLPEAVRSLPNVSILKFKLDPVSLERVRSEVGILS
jgi:hypothetical protein